MELFPKSENPGVRILSIETLATRRVYRPITQPERQWDFMLAGILGLRTAIPIVETGYPGRFIAPIEIADYTRFYQHTSHLRIMFDDYTHNGFTRPIPTRFDSSVQVGIVDSQLDPRIDPTNGVAVAGSYISRALYRGRNCTMAIIGQMQGKEFATPQITRENLTYLKWRELLVFYIEQLLLLYNGNGPTLPVEHIAIAEHPFPDRYEARQHKAAALLSGFRDLEQVLANDKPIGVYIKPVSKISPHRILQEYLQSLYTESRAHWDVVLSKTPSKRLTVRTGLSPDW